jgi:hypothetical protein
MRFALSAVFYLSGPRWLCFSVISVRNLALPPAATVFGHAPSAIRIVPPPLTIRRSLTGSN